ncbi:TraM recognition domain-containing protein [Paenibacillus sp. IITD108]|uniref:TraM recognition domain-containing protein n=1 Tax=Paenibacillus sp. IITD108 TaxID=3116649 RepID=UPI002F3FB297
MNEKLSDLNYRKWLPHSLVVISHTIVLLMLLSVLRMSYSLFWGIGGIGATSFKEQVPTYLHLFFPFYTNPMDANVVYFLIAVCLSIFTWLFGTRVKVSNSTFARRVISFIICAAAVAFHVCLFSSIEIIPIGYDPLMSVHDDFESPFKDSLNRQSVHFVSMIILSLPYIVLFLVLIRLFGLYREDNLIQEWFKNYKFENKRLGRFGDEKANVFPDITLATKVETNVPAVLTGDSRQLGVSLLGPPGSGKTSMKIIKAFRQDMEHMQNMINAFPKYAKKYGTGSEEFKRAMAKHLIASIIIEPAKDLCDSAYSIALGHGLPEELIIYLDPSTEDTPGINCMIGPLSQVAETITAVLDGMSEVSNEFFRQACRTVLKMYIYLIKIDRINNCDLLDLDRMYQDPRFTMDLVVSVEKSIPPDEDIATMVKDQRLYWMLVKRVIRWFRNDALSIQTDRDGIVMRYPKGHEHEGKERVIDLQSEFTRQTRNLLSDLIMNPYLARILINDRSVDVDRILAKGGILLCNTDNGLLGDVSNAFGKLVLMTVQNAVFRRKGDENTRALVSLFVDEFFDYINPPYLKLASQGRKYKIAPFVAFQTLAQLAVKYDDKFVQVTLGTTRNLIVYGGVSNYDAEILTEYFGSTTMDQIMVRESITPDKMQSPNFSYSESVTREEVAVATKDDIMFNPFKFSYCRLVHEGSTQKAFLAEGDFIDKGEANEWALNLNKGALEYFMNYWRNELIIDLQAEAVPELAKLEDRIDAEANEIIAQVDEEIKDFTQISKRFDGYSVDKTTEAQQCVALQYLEEKVEKENFIQNGYLHTSSAKERDEEDKIFAAESLSFSRNMSDLLNGVRLKKNEKVNFIAVKLEAGPNHKLDDLKNVSLEIDYDAQAFVQAVKEKSLKS